MRTIIAGSRGITDPTLVDEAVRECGWWPTVVISGTARGVDRLGEQWAEGQAIPVERFPADWKHGRAAGPIRNATMADTADALIAIWNGQSPGTRNMIHEARVRGLRVHVYRTDSEEGR